MNAFSPTRRTLIIAGALARQAGWSIMYPWCISSTTEAWRGSRVQPFRSIYEWHRSYYLYYRKHLAKDYFFLFNFFYYLAMAVKLLFAFLGNLLHRGKFADTPDPIQKEQKI